MLVENGYEKKGITLDEEQLNSVLGIELMQKALEYRFNHDELFRTILLATKGKYILHFERSGDQSYWGGSYKVLGKIG